MFRLVEVGRAFDGVSPIFWNGPMPTGAGGQARFNPSLGDVTHTVTIFAEKAIERYGHLVYGGHTLEGFKRIDVWNGPDVFGAPLEVTVESIPGTENWVSGAPITVMLGASGNARHSITEATILGDPIPFPGDKSGNWAASVTDGFVTKSANLVVTMGLGSASVIVTSQPFVPPGVIIGAVASAIIECQVVGRAAWNVVCKPIYSDGSPVMGKEALVILGDVETTGISASLYPARVAELVHRRAVPIDETFRLPIEVVRHRTLRQCSAFYQDGENSVVDTAIEEGGPAHPNGIWWDSGPWSNRTRCAVVWSRTAFGQTPASILDDLGSSNAIGITQLAPHRWMAHRFHEAAGATHVKRFSVRLPERRSFPTRPWYFSVSLPPLDTDELDATGGDKLFWTQLGNSNFSQAPYHEFRPYRWLLIDVESEVVQSLRFTLEWSNSLTFGRKSWIVAIAKGRQTIRIDLRDPDLITSLPVEECPQIDGDNPATQKFMPPSQTSREYRFGGMGAVNTLQIDLPAGKKLKVFGLELECQSAQLQSWRGSHSAGGEVDGITHLRVPGVSAFDVRNVMAEMQLPVTGEQWSLSEGWLTQSYGRTSIVDALWNRMPPGNLLTGVDVFSTHTETGFRGYWGMSQELPIGNQPVRVEVEYLWGHRLRAHALPEILSVLKFEWPPESTMISTDPLGTIRRDDRRQTLWPPTPPLGPTGVPIDSRVSCPRHAQPIQWWDLGWGHTSGVWSGIVFSPRGGGRRPARDVNAAQQHIRATARDGKLTLARRGNSPGGTWEATSFNQRSQGAAIRIDRASTSQRVHVVNERARELVLFSSGLDASSAELVRPVAAGSFPALCVWPDRRVCQYWFSGTTILGQLCDPDGTPILGPVVVAAGATPVGMSADLAYSRGGFIGTLLTFQSGGQTRLMICDDGLTATPVASLESGDLPEVLSLQDGRRYLYWSPEGTGEVKGAVLDARGLVIPPQIVATGMTPFSGIAVRASIGKGGQRRVWMSGTGPDGEDVELTSTDGLNFA